MKILVVSSSSGSRGGGEFYHVSLTKAYLDLGLDATVVLSDHQQMDELEQLIPAGARVVRLPFTNTYHRKFRSLGAIVASREIASMASHFRRLSPDVIHLVHQNVEDGLDLLKATEKSGLPFVSTIHITRSMHDLGAAFGRLRDRVARQAWRSSGAGLLTISTECDHQLRRYLGSQTAQAERFCIPNGVDDFQPPAKSPYRDEWGFKESDFVLGCVARIERQKNPLFVPTVLKSLPDSFKFVWVGDGSLRPQLEEAARELGVRDRILIDGWRSDARARMHAFDLFLLPSFYEGLPFALLEAMAAGLPIVSSSVDGISDVIEHGVNGLLAPVDDSAAWVEHLLALGQSPAERARLGAAARQAFLERYSLQAAAKATIAAYQTMIDRAKA